MSTKRHRFAIDNGVIVDCDKCGLVNNGCRNWYIRPDTNKKKTVDILIVGEAPGEEEDWQNKPFVGRSGKLLRDIVAQVIPSNYNVGYTNVCHCHPKDNKTPSARQIKTCLPILEKEIRELKPLVIILVGNTPLKAVLGETGITKWRGTVAEKVDYFVIPTFHPAYILRGNTEALKDVISDFEKAVGILEGDLSVVGDVSDNYEIEIVRTEAQAQKMVDTIKGEFSACAFDTETTGLDVTGNDFRMVCCSFAIQNKAWVVYPNNDTDSVITPFIDCYTYVCPVCYKPLDTMYNLDCKVRCGNCHEHVYPENVKKRGMKFVCHNAKFDYKVALQHYGVEIDVVDDTMLLAYLIDGSVGGHGLKPLAAKYLGMYDYDKPLQDYIAEHKEANPKYGGHYGNVPESLLNSYAANDAIATWELMVKLRHTYESMIKDTGLSWGLYEFVIKASLTLANVEYNGILIDNTVLDDYLMQYADRKAQLLEILRGDKHVKRYTEQRQITHNEKGFEFNPNSPQQLQIVLFEYMGLEPTGLTKTGKPSTGWPAIKCYSDEPFVGNLRLYKLVSKALSTYLEPVGDRWQSDDGRVRADYLLHSTSSGRLSSRNPNMQNIPSPAKEPGTILARLPIKNLFTCTYNEFIDSNRVRKGCLLAVDYASMELRTMAAIADVRTMKEAFNAGKDLHSVVACDLFGYDYDKFIERLHSGDKEIKSKRHKAKTINFAVLYGGSASLVSQLAEIPKGEADRLVVEYFNKFPEVHGFKYSQIAFARKHGYIESIFGRRRVLPYINDVGSTRCMHEERAAVNMPIQSAASDVLLASMTVIHDMMQQLKMKSLIVNTVHDSILFDVYPGELQELAVLVKDVMENIKYYGNEYFDLNFDWICVPLIADMETGIHYGNLSEYGVV